MTRYEEVQQELHRQPRRWLVTGAAGFIGSHLVEKLLSLNQTVVGLDNFSTGKRENLADVQSKMTADQWSKFRMMEGDTRRLDDCRQACAGVDHILHQAALGSVPRSIADPLLSHAANVDGFIHMLVAARDAGVRRFVYASSSSVYGDHPVLPKVESAVGNPLSPYAATKTICETYAGVFARCYKLETVGLRYFNVFGPRQDPDGAYAAVIPKWFAAAFAGTQIVINGDGENSRDFCNVADVVQANLLAAVATNPEALNRAYNIAAGRRTTLKQLCRKILQRVASVSPGTPAREPQHGLQRPGDVPHSHADISLAHGLLGYDPGYDVDRGLDEACGWYLRHGVN